MIFRRIYYNLRPFLPRRIQIYFRRMKVRYKLPAVKDVWPIDPTSAKPPENWKGWPGRKKFALVLTHDVETGDGQEKCEALMNLEMQLGFKSSFYFVPERYPVSTHLRNQLTNNGFEVGVHGLKHDGKLYQSEKIFQQRASRINYYLREWNSVGFRSPAMHHNLKWLNRLKIDYDLSTFDTDPFEPQPDGAGTIFPFRVDGVRTQKGYVELPYTLPQDFTLFIILKEKSINIWKEKIDWIASKGGMALLITHPDYMSFDGNILESEKYPVKYYKEFLQYITSKYEGCYWHGLPKRLSQFWKSWGGKKDR